MRNSLSMEGCGKFSDVVRYLCSRSVLVSLFYLINESHRASMVLLLSNESMIWNYNRCDTMTHLLACFSKSRNTLYGVSYSELSLNRFCGDV